MSSIRTPLADRCTVRLTVGQQMTPSGLVIPPVAQKIEKHGRVELVGPDCTLVHPGDFVLVDEFAGTVLEEARTERLVMYHEKDIQAIIEA